MDAPMKKPIYLDYNATTPLDPEVMAMMRVFMEKEFGNPSSSHWYGIAPKKAVEKARQQVAELLHCHPSEIIFTSGGTESNNHAIISAARMFKHKGGHIITSAIEHPSVIAVCKYLEKEGFETTYLPVDETGRVNVTDLGRAIRPETILITIMHANNETGVIQPIAEIGELAAAHGIVFHTDAAQSAGKIPTDVYALKVSMMTVAGHKLYAPKGVGALYVQKHLNLEPLLHGAKQENGMRPGTENVMGIVALGVACEIAGRHLSEQMAHMKEMRDRLHRRIAEYIHDVRLNGHPEWRLPNTLNLSFQGLTAHRILEEIGLKVAASAGAACHSAGVEISHVLAAMHVPENWAKGAVRFSVGRMTTASDVDAAAETVVKAVSRLNEAP